MVPVTSLIWAHYSKLAFEPVYSWARKSRTSTCFPSVTFRTSCIRLRSHRRTWPSDDADTKVLKDFDAIRVVTLDLCPKKHALGVKSTAFAVEVTAQTDIVQSVPAVAKVLESANNTHDSCP